LSEVSRTAILALAAITITIAASAQPVRVGIEFQVNAVTVGIQAVQDVAIDTDGDFTVVWMVNGQDGDGRGVFGRRFGSTGAPLTGDFQVNSSTISIQDYPAISAAGGGDWVVVWQGFVPNSNLGVFGRRFDSAGAPVAAEFQVNAFTTDGDHRYPTVGVTGDGAFVVAWQGGQDGDSGGIFGRRFAADGASLASEFRINTSTAYAQTRPALAIDDEGGFVVVWQSYDGDQSGIFGRRFDSTGSPLNEQFLVNTYTTNRQTFPQVAIDGNDDFVVTWDSDRDDFGATDFSVFMRRFSSAGTALGGESRVNVITAGTQAASGVEMEPDGDFLVTWASAQYTGFEVLARAFDSAGTPRTGEFRVNTHTDNHQTLPSLAMAADGDFVIVWRSEAQEEPGDCCVYGLFAQRFGAGPPAALDVDSNGRADPLTDGLLIMRALFGFTGQALVGGAVGAGCTRCTSTTIRSYVNGQADFDVDGNGGVPDPLTDGLLLLRFLFGFNGSSLTTGAVADDCERCTEVEIVGHLQSLV
jgi:hypothetical protein